MIRAFDLGINSDGVMSSPSKEDIERMIECKTCEESLLEYTKYAFRKKNQKEFMVNWHHEIICEHLEKVYTGEIKNLVINISPRYSKTEIGVKMFIEWCFAKQPKCKFIHLSYSEMLALDNSGEIREDIKSEWYQKHWPRKLKKGEEAKGSWESTDGGAMYATGTMGSLTGFGAGMLGADTFHGAVIIDDALKPDEAFSDIIRNKANDRLNTTIMSRRNNPKTPIIIIMQRIHEEDMSGFVLNGGVKEKFTHLCLPVLTDHPASGSTGGKLLPLWPEKHNLEQINVMREASPSVFAGQYMQNPVAGTGNMFTREMFHFGTIPEEYDYSYVTMDTAYTDKESSDFTVMLFGKVRKGQLFIDNVYRKKVKAELLEEEAVRFIRSSTAYGFRGAYIEPKGHGIYLSQALPGRGIIMPSELTAKEFFKDRKMNKVERCNNVLPYLNNKQIIINEQLHDKEIYIDEAIAFPRAKHDDFVDALIDMIKLVYTRDISILDVL